MNRIVRLREEADRDLASAAAWYEQQREGLGHEFLDEALAAFQRIGGEPLTYPVVHRNARRALMTRFPFGIYFRVEQSTGLTAAMSMSHQQFHAVDVRRRTRGDGGRLASESSASSSVARTIRGAKAWTQDGEQVQRSKDAGFHDQPLPVLQSDP